LLFGCWRLEQGGASSFLAVNPDSLSWPRVAAKLRATGAYPGSAGVLQASLARDQDGREDLLSFDNEVVLAKLVHSKPWPILSFTLFLARITQVSAVQMED
jgi:hypothetical protein